MPQRWSFNPTLVRLRHHSNHPLRHWAILFQSHAGSIEALMRGADDGTQMGSFNPTLVRLRRPTQLPGSGQISAFQSHAGSIEAIPKDKIWGIHIGFQSHAGSIEAAGGAVVSSSKKISFNPTLVRLRLISPKKGGAK